jgi:MoxR-like ATPase
MLKSQIGTLSKDVLINALRSAGQKVGDFARIPKDVYVSRVMDMGDDFAMNLLSEANPVAHSLIEGAFSGAAVAKVIPMPAAKAADKPAVEELPEIKSVGKKSLKDLFGISGAAGKFMVSVWNDPSSPAFDPDYRWDPGSLHEFAAAVERGRSPWLGGPAGTGKTEFCKNFAAATGRAFVRVSMDSGIERYELIGGERVRAGDLVYVPGIILRAFVRPGALVLLDECAIARPEYLAALHAPLDSGVITVPETGEVVRKAPGVCFCAADNSMGKGDHTGTYAAVREMNAAFTDRFSTFLAFTYLPPAEEIKVLMARAKTGDGQPCPEPLAEMIVAFLTVCRKASETAQIEAPPSLRQAIYLAENLMDGVKPRRAFEATMVNRAAPEVHEQLQQLWKANVTEAVIAKAATGKELSEEDLADSQAALASANVLD